ncbi:hypothetical protein BZG01_00115 [Labilibaculum manganireducens]|uniref:Transposase n=1 Tax=Labilibaculum manganireducens TaxID=1940525 RepID=A0A2N3IGE9_9BACT|nr:hypothetical protein [Labilibaculum manganireducens]PKQ69377.1 hypothetical protein BZG01_00115 [Labilibaculum manganireducens]
MAYNRRNHLIKVLEIQEVYLKAQKTGATQKWIYEHLIYPNWRISSRTLTNYLGTNARKELKEIDHVEQN